MVVSMPLNYEIDDFRTSIIELFTIPYKSTRATAYVMMTSEKATKSISIATALLVTAIASIGFTGGVQQSAFGSVDGSAMTNDTTSATTAETSPDASKMNGVIASIQRDENGNPAWITAGHWNLESDVPLIGGSDVQTEPHVNNFSATLYMVSNADGTAQHSHQVSDFTQTGVLHEGPNATTVNGTFTVTLREGPVENVNGYIHITNDKLEFYLDPAATENHFGPTTITGIVLSPESFSDMTGGRGAHEGMMTSQ